MYTSLLFVAFSGMLVASSQQGVAWQSDYQLARKAGEAQQKPLAVFIGSGAGGYEKVCRDGKLGAEAQKALEDGYVCVYVDASTPAGQKLAADFAVTRGLGLVLSDRPGNSQAFFHDGDLSETDLTRWLKHFADPNVIV